MSTDIDIQVGPTADYEAWRVNLRSSVDKNAAIIHPDAIAGLVRPVRPCGLAALDIATANILRSQRSPLDARRDGMDDCKLLFQVSGRSTLTQDERTTELAAGDLGFIDITRPVSLVCHQGPGRLIGLHLPSWPLKSHLGFEPQGGWSWRGDALPARLLQRLILEAIDESEAVAGSAESEFFMQSAVYNLVGALFGTSDLPRHFSHGDRLFVRICTIIKRHFPDPDVGPIEVAAEAGISVRYLQKLFAARGTTCRHYLRSVRLDHAAQLLNRGISTNTTFHSLNSRIAAAIATTPIFPGISGLALGVRPAPSVNTRSPNSESSSIAAEPACPASHLTISIRGAYL
jgi:AraC family transcriptional regulator, positive regulator of tynA and feaB